MISNKRLRVFNSLKNCFTLDIHHLDTLIAAGMIINIHNNKSKIGQPKSQQDVGYVSVSIILS